MHCFRSHLWKSLQRRLASQLCIVRLIFFATLLLLPFGNMLVKLACLTIRDNPNDALDNPADEFSLLDERFLDKPSLAMEHCMQVTNNMAELSKDVCLRQWTFRVYSGTQSEAVSTMEERVDRYEDMLGNIFNEIKWKRFIGKGFGKFYH